MTVDERSGSATLSPDAVDFCMFLLGIDVLPVVLGTMSTHDDSSALARARLEQRAAFEGAGLLDGDDLAPKLVDLFSVLARPTRELAMRLYTPTDVLRLCLVTDASQRHVLAMRGPESIVLQDASVTDSPQTVAAPVLAALGRQAAAQFDRVNAPTQTLVDALEAGRETGDYESALRRAGATEDDAAALGAALGSMSTYAEIVAIAHGDAKTTQAPGAVVVYNTAKGRVVASPSLAADGALWSTFTPGTDHRIVQAVASLLSTLAW
ncbi:ESX secretion-associated protein EspG [Rhodococcus sp. D2-41]|uniref:ESX secretion-associated protein EspG n=1 Tax=Speluncibacter jeojiensis TaxID=2710754 RepID=UPI0024107A2C|nr:ESX secretion-associated protein EspG [Rhodococcus sp. D2-41]MDG3010012.1 ESX secretion-associated protein EspG [Rhodococcus sp. D2-41]